MTVQSNKSLGGVGACLAVTGIISTIVSVIQLVTGSSTASWIGFTISSVVGVLAFVGFILFLVAMYGFSKDYAERRIFMYIIYGILIAIVSGVIIGVASIGFAIISVLSNLSNAGSPSGSQALITPYTAVLIPALSAVTLVVMFFIYRSFNLLAEKSVVPLFRTAGKIFVLSAIINIVLATVFAVLAYTNVIQYQTIVLALTPGAFIQYIGWALSAKGFFAIQPPAPPTAPAQLYPTANQPNYCPNCGTPTQPDSVYCVRCGKKL